MTLSLTCPLRVFFSTLAPLVMEEEGIAGCELGDAETRRVVCCGQAMERCTYRRTGTSVYAEVQRDWHTAAEPSQSMESASGKESAGT